MSLVNQAKVGLNQPVNNAVLAGWFHLARGHIIGTNFAICLFVKF